MKVTASSHGRRRQGGHSPARPFRTSWRGFRASSATLPSTDPLFDAMATAPAIAIKVAKTAKEIPLKSARQQGPPAFNKACRKS